MFHVPEGRWKCQTIPPSLQDGFFICRQPDTSCLANFQLSLRDDASGANAIRFNSFNVRGKPRKLSGLGFSLDAGHLAETG